MGVHPAWFAATAAVFVPLMLVGGQLYSTELKPQVLNSTRFTAPIRQQLTVQQALHWASISWAGGNQPWQSAARPALDSFERTLTSDRFEQLNGKRAYAISC